MTAPRKRWFRCSKCRRGMIRHPNATRCPKCRSTLIRHRLATAEECKEQFAESIRKWNEVPT